MFGTQLRALQQTFRDASPGKQENPRMNSRPHVHGRRAQFLLTCGQRHSGRGRFGIFYSLMHVDARRHYWTPPVLSACHPSSLSPLAPVKRDLCRTWCSHTMLGLSCPCVWPSHSHSYSDVLELRSFMYTSLQLVGEQRFVLYGPVVWSCDRGGVVS